MKSSRQPEATTIERIQSMTKTSGKPPEEFANQMRLAAAATWYEQGKISQEIAARVAGLDRTDFLLALARMGKNSFQIDLTDLDRELARE